MVHIVTIFDKNYLGRALAFRYSMTEHVPGQHVYFLCLDDMSASLARRLNLADTTIMTVEDLGDAELTASRSNRTLPEFASTCKPAFLLYMLNSGKVGTDDLLVFIDPDFALYQSPEQLWKDMYAGGSVIVTPHRFLAHRAGEAARKGTYNAGIVAFRNDETARACLTTWRRQCIEWCYLRYEDGKIADQGYMNDWNATYSQVYELPHIGVNLANWNIENYDIKNVDGHTYIVDGVPLIFYHFHGLKIYRTGAGTIRPLPSTVAHTGIYDYYIRLLNMAYQTLDQLEPGWTLGTMPHPGFLRILKQTIWRIFA